MPHSFFFFCLFDVFATMIGEIKVSYIADKLIQKRALVVEPYKYLNLGESQL